ncbi:hypothetical protein [Roseibium sp. SCP14]|uniref:VpaChn25_0724 family phage protein n=1 Tax=Roseibium sp. SCP14 TaxID=3141375 RepID=UPI00333D6AC4
MSYSDHATADYRLIILKALALEKDKTLNETLIEKELESFGHNKSRDFLRAQLKKLEDMGAIKLTEPGSVYVAELLRPGLDHVQLKLTLDGVLEPTFRG